MTKPSAPPGRSRKRSRLFQAAPDALYVEEWVPNITLPPPPDAPLEDDEGEVLLDEHGLPERLDDDDEPEEERRGPARIYVGPGTADRSGGGQRDELPVGSADMPSLSIPGDEEDDSEPSMPDLSIDGSGSDWGGVFDTDDGDDEELTDPEADTDERADAPTPIVMSMPEGLAGSDPQEPQADASEPTKVAPKTDMPAPKLDRPRAAPFEARPTPSWSRPKEPEPQPITTADPPRIRDPKPPEPRPQAQPKPKPKPPEPGIGSLVPRSLIIAFVVLAILVSLVWALRRPDSDAPIEPPGPPPAEQDGPKELTIQPGALDLGDGPKGPPPSQPAEPPEPAGEPEPEPAAAAPAQPVSNPEPVRPAPAQAEPAPAAAANPEPAPVTRPKPAPAPAAKPAPEVRQTVPEPEAPAATDDAFGFLVVESDRYAMVYMGGRRLGGTPIARMELDPGSYAVRAVCRDTGATKTMQVDIQPGELTTAAFRFMP